VGSFLRKYNSSGVLQWERKPSLEFPTVPGVYRPMALSNIATDGTDFFLATYSGGGPPSTSPTAAWTYNYSNVYLIGDTANYYNAGHDFFDMSVWDSDGDLVTVFKSPTHPDYPGSDYYSEHYGIRRLVYHDGSLYCACPIATGYESAYRFDATTFALQDLLLDELVYQNNSSVPVPNSGFSIPFFTLDANGYHYFTGASGDIVKAYDDAGDPLWTTPITNAGYWRFRGLSLQLASSLPALALPIALARPSWLGDRYTPIPALALPLSLGAITTIRDYIGPPVAIVYRLFLDGSPPLELALKSFSLRRTGLGSQLSLVIAAPTLDELTIIEARLNDDLILYRGWRLPDGTEQLDTLAQMPLIGIRADQGARSLSVSLEGKIIGAEDQPKTRTVSGLSYRANNDGRARVRGDIDTYLRVGDTADLGGGETLLVAEITISVNPTSGVMEISS
jgi:hypothetical protein